MSSHSGVMRSRFAYIPVDCRSRSPRVSIVRQGTATVTHRKRRSRNHLIVRRHCCYWRKASMLDSLQTRDEPIPVRWMTCEVG
jgi:hypothetical protein